MKISVNGKSITLAGTVSMIDLLAMKKEKRPESVLVYVNHKVLPSEDYETTYLKDGDIVEIHELIWGM